MHSRHCFGMFVDYVLPENCINQGRVVVKMVDGLESKCHIGRSNWSETNSTILRHIDKGFVGWIPHRRWLTTRMSFLLFHWKSLHCLHIRPKEPGSSKPDRNDHVSLWPFVPEHVWCMTQTRYQWRNVNVGMNHNGQWFWMSTYSKISSKPLCPSRPLVTCPTSFRSPTASTKSCGFFCLDFHPFSVHSSCYVTHTHTRHIQSPND